MDRRTIAAAIGSCFSWSLRWSLRRTDQVVCAVLLAVALVVLAWHAARPLNRPPAIEFRRVEELPAGFVIEANRSPWVEWTLLPGIGPKLAKRIVAYRERVGPFRTVEDLLAVPGIGPRRLEQIRPYLRIEEASSFSQSAPRSRAGAE